VGATGSTSISRRSAALDFSSESPRMVRSEEIFRLFGAHYKRHNGEIVQHGLQERQLHIHSSVVKVARVVNENIIVFITQFVSDPLIDFNRSQWTCIVIQTA
jgi:hypothetical protein